MLFLTSTSGPYTPQMLYRWLVRILGATHEYRAFGLGARGTGEVGEEGEDEGAKTNTLRTKPPAKPMYPHYSSSFPYQLRLRAMPSSNMNTSSVVPQPPLRVQIFLLDPSLRYSYTVRRCHRALGKLFDLVLTPLQDFSFRFLAEPFSLPGVCPLPALGLTIITHETKSSISRTPLCR